jgi:hypothetical protein
LTKRSLGRRSLFRAAAIVPLALSAGACADMGGLFAPKKKYSLTPRGDRMVLWLQRQGHDAMMAPEAFAVMGLVNGGRDVISLVGFRSVHEFVLHRKQGDMLTFHHCDTKFTRLSSARYPRTGKPTFITDSVAAEADFQQQLTFWFDQMPGR